MQFRLRISVSRNNYLSYKDTEGFFCVLFFLAGYGEAVNNLFKFHKKTGLETVLKRTFIVILYKIKLICSKLLTNSIAIIYN